MTRKERIDQASAINAAYVGEFGIVGRLTKEKMLTYQNGFIRGAEWSDENPSNPWVLLVNDAPYNHEEYLDSSDCTVSVLVINDDGWTEVAYMIKEDGKWSWMASLNNIVAWMPIPYFRYNHDRR